MPYQINIVRETESNTNFRKVLFTGPKSQLVVMEIPAGGEGDDVSVKFNVRYLLDGIMQINQEYIVFNLNGSESPLLIKGKGDSSCFYLIMPMRGA